MNRAAIASVELRSTGDSHLFFNIDEKSYKDGSDRPVTTQTLLDGTVLVKDWGYAEGRSEIILVLNLSVDEYELLLSFQQDNDNEFLFHYKKSYRVVLRSVQKSGMFGGRVLTAVKMSVIAEISGNGEY